MSFSVIDANGNLKESIASGTPSITETNISLSDVTTDDVSTTKHGFAPKAPNDTQKWLRGDATWANIPSENTVTSTGNIDDLNFSNASIIRMNNASLATIRGLVAGVAGQVVAIVSIGAGEVDLAHQNTNSTAANRLINSVTSGITPLAAGVGTAVYQYDGTTARWRLVSHNQGAPISVAFSAGNFTGNGTMTWTLTSPDQVTYAFYLTGRVLRIFLKIQTSTVGGSVNTNLLTTLPNGYTLTAGFDGGLMSHFVADNGTNAFGYTFAATAVSTTQLVHRRNITPSNWTLSTDLTQVIVNYDVTIT